MPFHLCNSFDNSKHGSTFRNACPYCKRARNETRIRIIISVMSTVLKSMLISSREIVSKWKKLMEFSMISSPVSLHWLWPLAPDGAYKGTTDDDEAKKEFVEQQVWLSRITDVVPEITIIEVVLKSMQQIIEFTASIQPIVAHWNSCKLQIDQVIVLFEFQSRAMCKDWFEEDGALDNFVRETENNSSCPCRFDLWSWSLTNDLGIFVN